jgi:hypothetical protein
MPLSEGRAGVAREPPDKMELFLLPPYSPKESVFHFSRVFTLSPTFHASQNLRLKENEKVPG